MKIYGEEDKGDRMMLAPRVLCSFLSSLQVVECCHRLRLDVVNTGSFTGMLHRSGLPTSCFSAR